MEELAIEPLSPSMSPMPLPTNPIKPTFAQRYTLEGCASISNAAETHYFHNRALVYHFVNISDTVEDEVGKLISCTLQCGICGRSSWKWS